IGLSGLDGARCTGTRAGRAQWYPRQGRRPAPVAAGKECGRRGAATGRIHLRRSRIRATTASATGRADRQRPIHSWRRDDKVNRPAGGPILANLLPNAQLVMTSDTGHWMQWERADLFNQLVPQFLSEESAFTS